MTENTEHDGHTIDVGYVHVLTEPGGPCVDNCPHPTHANAERVYGWEAATIGPDAAAPSAENDGIRETRGTHTIEAECLHCGCDGLWPNKGLGRATYATWRTRHGANCHVLPPVDSDCACGHDHGVSTTTCDRCYWCQQETA